MKITPKQYAQALYELVVDTVDGNATKKITQRFVSVLTQRRDLNKLTKIMDEFNKEWNKRNELVEGSLQTARAIDDKILADIENYVAKVSGAKQAILTKSINASLHAGFVARAGDLLIDASAQGRWRRLREHLAH